MNLGTFVGIAGWVACLIFSIYTSGGQLITYFDIPSIFCTIGGSTFSMILQYGFKDFFELLKVMGLTRKIYKVDTGGQIRKLQELSEKARREGLLALEEVVEEVDDPFMKNGLKLVVDGTDAEIIKALMENELSGMNARHEKWLRAIDAWSKLAPGFGMLGTVLGLIAMLKNLADKSRVGPNMAVALITTFYGAILANALFQPMLGQLATNDAKETTYREMAIEGVLSIQAGDNPRIMTLKLLSYLDPVERAKLELELLKD
jgi:chemotaxis protein MotA